METEEPAPAASPGSIHRRSLKATAQLAIALRSSGSSGVKIDYSGSTKFQLEQLELLDNERKHLLQAASDGQGLFAYRGTLLTGIVLAFPTGLHHDGLAEIQWAQRSRACRCLHVDADRVHVVLPRLLRQSELQPIHRDVRQVYGLPSANFRFSRHGAVLP